MKSFLKIFLFFVTFIIVSLPLALLFNYFEDSAEKIFQKEYRVFFSTVIAGISSLIAYFIFQKYEDLIASNIYNKLGLGNAEKTGDKLLNNSISTYSVRFFGGKCYNCSELSMSSISYKFNQKGIFRCSNCNCVNKQNQLYGMIIIIASILIPILFIDLYKKYLYIYFEIPFGLMILLFFLFVLFIYRLLIRNLNINSMFDLVED
tara:strand:+ start:51 stop:665 length:615 start_codon:yes stop_codon:yes gene_type:complete